MKQAAAHPTTKSPRGNDTQVLGTLVKDLASTAWRIAVPVVLLALGGIFIDRAAGSAPWATLGLTLVGFGIAAWLVKNQLQAVEKRESKS